MRLRKKVLYKHAVRYGHWFLLLMIASYVVSKVVVNGNNLLAGVIDVIFNGGRIDFNSFSGEIAILIIIGAFSGFIKSMAAELFSINVQMSFKNKAVEKVMKLEFRYFDEKDSGGIINKFVSDITETGYFFSETLPDLCSSSITIDRKSVV